VNLVHPYVRGAEANEWNRGDGAIYSLLFNNPRELVQSATYRLFRNASALMGVTAIYRIPAFTTVVFYGDSLLVASVLCELFRNGNSWSGLRHR
jgi:hypothetical protein